MAVMQEPDVRQTPGQVCYVFAVGRADGSLKPVLPELTGPTGSPVRTVCGAGLCALVCSVPEGLYDEEGLRAQLEDLERLEAMARAHHDVVAAAYEHTTVLPMRLATVYLDDARVTEMLAGRKAEFDALLGRLEGQLEWGVKVYADPRAAVATAAATDTGTDTGTGTGTRNGAGKPDDGAAESSSPGRVYLQQRRRQRSRHRDSYRAAGAVVERITSLADGLATAKVAHRPQHGELAQGSGENIANDAYLVPADRSEDFRAAIGGLAEDLPGVRVELTGPWAPYSFATPPFPSSPQPASAEGTGDGA